LNWKEPSSKHTTISNSLVGEPFVNPLNWILNNWKIVCKLLFQGYLSQKFENEAACVRMGIVC